VQEVEMLAYLTAQHIPYQYVAHPPVYTCDQAEQLRPDLSGVSTKNLFFQDEKKRFYLVMTACEKRLNLKALGRLLEAPKLHFGSAESLLELLGVTAGAVTVLGLIHDTQHQVRLIVDAEIWSEAHYLCHPLVNTATLVLTKNDLLRFFELTGHTPRALALPAA
jgi:Ala-tRNA(Pro) deacylase